MAEAELATKIFKAVGQVWQVPENLMDAVTALSGSGPAYIFKLAEDLISAGSDLGLTSELARALALQTISGAAQMLSSGTVAPAALRQAVTSPGGTTEAALNKLADNNIAQIWQQALTAARDRSQVLSQTLAAEMRHE